MRLSTSMLPDVVALTGTYDEQPRDLLGDRRRWDDLRAVGEELFEVVARWLRATKFILTTKAFGKPTQRVHVVLKGVVRPACFPPLQL
jgi:hypothetical protein